MSSIPEKVREICKRVEEEYCTDLDCAIMEAVKEVKKHSDLQLWVDDLVSRAVQDLVYQIRFNRNRATKVKATQEAPALVGVGGKPYTLERVLTGRSKAVSELSALEVLRIRIGQGTLGSMLGADIEAEADKVRAQAKGKFQMASFLDSLKDRVKPNQTVDVAFRGKGAELVRLYKEAINS
jgi:hypothetical protein